MTTTNTAPRKNKARQAVTVAVFAAILIAALWSIANIGAAANHYHANRASLLLGVAFGVANALSVYALATAKTRHSRTPAIIGTIVFSVGSAAIQYHLYADILGVATAPAFWFASLGPLTEALLAWLEAGLHKEDQIEITNARIEELSQDLVDAEERAAAAEAAGSSADEAARKAQKRAETLEDQLQAAQPGAPAAPQQRSQADSGDRPLTNNEEKWIERIEAILETQPGEIWTTDRIAGALEASQRSAQRYAALGVEAGRFYKNGDNGYHAG